MKFVLYSDIHAQLAQLEAVQEAVDKENADKEIVAGDLVMLGPDPGPVVENIRNRKNCDVIVGNLDVWVVDKRAARWRRLAWIFATRAFCWSVSRRRAMANVQ